MTGKETQTSVEVLSDKKCQTCEKGIGSLAGERLEELIAQVPLWPLTQDKKMISRTFRFADFAGALEFAYDVGQLADEEGHHPVIHLSWGKVIVELTTHSVGGLSENDFILAAKIDRMLEGRDLE